MIAAQPSAPLPRFLRLQEIETLPELQPRVALLTEVVEDYRDRYRSDPAWPNAGMAMDPLGVIVTAEGRILLWDGFHRHAAGRAAEILMFPVEASHGTFESALRKSLGANSKHGLRRTQEDKQRAVTKALSYWPEKSNRDIAEICNVSHTMVNDYRPAGSSGVAAARPIILPPAEDVTLPRTLPRNAAARLVRAPQTDAPTASPTRTLPGERRIGLERMAEALELYLDTGRELAEGHPDKLLLLILLREIEEAGDKAVLTLGGGE